MYLQRDYFKAKVYTIWVHGPHGLVPVRKAWGLNVTKVIPGVLSSARADPGCGVEELKSYECSSTLIRLFSNSLRKTYTFMCGTVIY